MKGMAKRLWITLCGVIAAICLVMGIWVNAPVMKVSAASGTPTVTMLPGASARKTPGEPGIKFTAKIDSYDNSYQYGMLILPEEAWGNLGWDNDTDYIAELTEMGAAYANSICAPYIRDGEYFISFSLKNIYPYNYDMSFVGVAYTLKDGVYNYADVDLVGNGRSIAYVAQMALKYEENLTSEQEAALEKFVNASNIQIDKEDYWKDPSAIVGGTTAATADNYAAKRTFNVSEEVSFITKKAYAGDSEVSFKYYIPAGTTNCGWWGIAWHTNKDSANNYHAAGAENALGYKALGKELGVWVNFSFTLPAGGPYYLYFGSEVDETMWGLNGGNSYALIDDFKVGATTESFTDNINESIFNANANVISSYLYEKAEVSFGEAPREYSAKIIVDKIKSDVGTATFVTKNSYPVGSVVKFKYYMPTDVQLGSWAKLCCVSNPASGDIYGNWILDLPIMRGQWIEEEVTLTSAGYLHFAADVGQWGKGEGYILIDDFSVTSNGTTVTDDFNNGVSGGLFNVNIADAVVEGEGYVYVEKELAMKFIPNAGEAVSAITKEAYAAGSTVSFKYYIPAGTQAGWWGIAWHTDATKANNYHAAGVEDPVGHQALGKELGAWTDVSFTLPVSGGPYYLYFGANTGDAWKVNGENSYILIDDFTVNGETDTFNGGYENSLFTVKDANRTTLSADGEGYTGEAATPEEIGEVAMKYIFNASGETVSQVTKQAYAGGSTVSFKYYIPAGTITKWWGIVWSTKNTGLDIYAAASSASAYPLSTTLGEWVNVSFTLPAGGPYYLYFGSEVGHWEFADGSNAYVFIDDFTVNGETETFNYGIENSIFNVLVAGTVVNSEDGEGFVALNGEFGVKLAINSISSNASTPSFITSSKYAGGVTVTFDYYMSGNTNDKWWSFNWTTNNTVASIYAFVENNPNQQGLSLPRIQGSWQTVSVEIPAGEWYFYFGGAVGEWGDGYVIIDNFKIGDVVTETFNNGEYGIFLNNKADAITIADGKAAEVVPDEPVEENPDPYALVNLLKDESKLLEFLANGGYAWLAANGTIDATNMPASRLLLEGCISFTLTGEKEFAIYFGNGAFIFVNSSVVEVYNGTTKIGAMEYAAQGEAKLYLTITADGKLNLRIGEDSYKAFGKVTIDGLMMKIVALGGNGIVKFTEVNLDTYKCTNYVEDAPIYASDETIDFTAYAFDSDNMVSEEGFRLLSEAGFTKTLALLQGRVDGLNYNSPSQAEVERLMAQVNADALAALELAEKYGMKHYVFNEPLYNLERQTAWYDWVDELKDSATYTLSNAFAGHYFADEPTYETTGNVVSGHTFDSSKGEIVELVNAYKAYKKAFPEGEAFINLLPLDKVANSLFGDGTAPYQGYVDYYIENIGKDLGYVSFDHYPLAYDGGITDYHLFNFEYVATKCKAANIELRFYIKASNTGNEKYYKRATTSINDLYMQIYSGLAYGAKEIIYYQFTDHKTTDGTAGDAVMNGTSLAVNDVYNWAKQANNEVRMFGTAYMNFTWQSASVFGKTSITQFNNLKSKASAYGYISSVTSDASVLVGNFARNANVGEQNGDKYAYMVVNYGNTNSATTAEVKITFNGTPKKALVYQGGKASVVTLSNNVLTLNLMIGEGAFVIPFI